jgi:hypothetical protein
VSATPPAPGLDLPALLTATYRGALTGADAYRAVRQAVRVEEGTLRLGNRFVRADRYREIAFVALGNASASLALGAWEALGERLTQGIVAGPSPLPPNVPFRAWELPIGWPGSAVGLTTAAAIEELAAGLGPKDLLLLLLSPGALAALSLPPAGLRGEEWAAFLRAESAAGATGAEVAGLARVLGLGPAGGRLGAAPHAGEVVTLLLDRGDGAAGVGGGPTVPLTEEEVRRVRERLGPGRGAPLPAAVSTAAREPVPLRAAAPGVDRPVVVLAPADALTGASGVLSDRKWVCRLAAPTLAEMPEAAARSLLNRTEEILRGLRGIPGARRSGSPRRERPNGLAVLAGLTFGAPEGVDERPLVDRFLASARALLPWRGATVAVLPTAGAPGRSGEGAGRYVSIPTSLAGTLPMRAGLSDVGSVGIVLLPAEGAAPPATS